MFVVWDVLMVMECERLVDVVWRLGWLSFWYEDAEARNRKLFRNVDMVEVMLKMVVEVLWV